MNDYVTSLDTEPSPEVTVLSKNPLQGLSFQQRLALRDLLREGPRTTNQLSSWWDWEGREPVHRSEDERREAEKDWTASNHTARFTARRALHSLEYEGLISSEVRKILPSDGRSEFWWTLTPRGEEIAKRIDDELGEAAQRADAMLEKGSLDVQRVWKRVLKAIKEIQREELAAIIHDGVRV
jgi:DNA-binding MarR family transcriptional regulator